MEEQKVEDNGPNGAGDGAAPVTDAADPVTDAAALSWEYDPDAWSLTDLPEVVLVRLMQYLPDQDRFIFSLTCATMDQLFRHPSVWHQREVELLDNILKYDEAEVTLKRPETLLVMADHIGNCLKDLTLKLSGSLKKPSQECVAVVEKLMSNCRLRSLTLHVGQISSGDGTKPDPAAVQVILKFVQEAVCLSRFSLRRWPMRAAWKDVDIFKALRENPRLRELEMLSLFWESPETTAWTPPNPILPPAHDTLLTIRHFTYLQILNVRLLMLTDEVLMALSESSRVLKVLRLLLDSPRAEDGSRRLPSLTHEAWSRLMKSHPKLQVDISINSIVPNEVLSLALISNIRVTSVSFMRFAKINHAAIHSIADKFKGTLLRFYDYTESQTMDSPLIYLAERCTRLTHMCVHSYVNANTVMALAVALKGSCEVLAIPHEKILVHNPEQDDDAVLKRRPDGSLYFRWQEASSADANRAEIIKGLREQVSATLGRTWRPVGCGENGELPDSELNMVLRGLRLTEGWNLAGSDQRI